jgi:hypothetical protein
MLCGKKDVEDDVGHILLELCARDRAEAVAEQPAAK